MDRKILISAFTLAGSIIGAGILGLPYAFSKVGFGMGLFYLIFLGLLMMLVYLYLGEISLRVNSSHQLPGYAEKFLGKKGKITMIIIMLFMIHSSLLAYLLGSGKSFSLLFFGNMNYAVMFSVLFWVAMSFLLRGGLKGLKKIEPYGVTVIILIIVGAFFLFGLNIDSSNLTTFDNSFLFLPIGVVIFAFLGFTTIPELKMELGHDLKLMKKAIIIGVTIPIVLYTLFTFSVVGFFGNNLAEIVTLTDGFGLLANLLGIFTMTTSYFILSFSMFDMYLYDLHFTKKNSYFLTILLPIVLFLGLLVLKVESFIGIISLGGVISGGSIGIFTIWMNYKAKLLCEKLNFSELRSRNLNSKPAYSIPINLPIVIGISLLFVIAIVLRLFF